MVSLFYLPQVYFCTENLRVQGAFVVLLHCIGGELPMAGVSSLPSVGCLAPPESQLSEEEKLFLTCTDIHHEPHRFETNP